MERGEKPSLKGLETKHVVRKRRREIR